MMLMIAIAILFTPAALMLGIRGPIGDSEGSSPLALTVMYLVMTTYFLPATAIAAGLGALILRWFLRKPIFVRGVAFAAAFSMLMAFAVGVLLSFASFGHVPLVQDATPYLMWAAVAGLAEAAFVALLEWRSTSNA